MRTGEREMKKERKRERDYICEPQIHIYQAQILRKRTIKRKRKAETERSGERERQRQI